MKIQDPRSKIQRSSNIQTSIHRHARGHVGAWRLVFLWCLVLGAWIFAPRANSAVLDKDAALAAQSFWDNRDFDWFKANIPFFECPDADIVTTYYYRWELITKHLTYGSPNSGYSFTEFIDRPFWSGAYGAISCPAGHQLYEVRWLRDATIARDYSRYWFRTEGAQPRRYGTWIPDGVWAVHQVHPDDAFVKDLLPDLTKNFEGWAQRQFVPEVGLFWQNGHDDGMEFNINSRQTKDILRGANGYRPGFNAYMWADALAIARIARLAGNDATAKTYEAKAAGLKEKLQKLLWDPKREFFFPMSMRDETDKEGNVVKKHTLTYQSGKFAGNQHGREEHAFIPWQFNLPDAGYESAWKFLMDSNYFYADYGPLTVERNDPMFLLQKSCCWWSGQSWPYSTAQTLKALANVLQNYKQNYISRADYVKLLHVFAISHRKDGKPAQECSHDARPACRAAFTTSNCLIASNFAISAVLMMRFAEQAAPYFDTAEIIELHHDQKVDAPSGTAVTTARRMAAASAEWAADPTKHELYPGARGGAGPAGIRLHSVRMRGMVAHQEVILGAAGQTLTIRQDSYDRSSYMPGVVLACKRVADHPGVTEGLDAVL